MKRINRRQFTKLAGGAALVPVLAPRTARAAPLQEPAARPAQQPPQPAEEAKPKYGMTKEQEDRVKQALERNDRQRVALRNFKLAYSAEPAFVFQVKRSQGSETSKPLARGRTAQKSR
jgi:hypothetical protein